MKTLLRCYVIPPGPFMSQEVQANRALSCGGQKGNGGVVVHSRVAASMHQIGEYPKVK